MNSGKDSKARHPKTPLTKPAWSTTRMLTASELAELRLARKQQLEVLRKYYPGVKVG